MQNSIWIYDLMRTNNNNKKEKNSKQTNRKLKYCIKLYVKFPKKEKKTSLKI